MNQVNEFDMIVPVNAHPKSVLRFEKPLVELENQIAKLERVQKESRTDCTAEIQRLRNELVKLTTEIYQSLSAWEVVQVARHPGRPVLRDYVELMVKNFCELHGDRYFGNDRAIVTGLGRIGREKVMVVGHNKGKTTHEKIACNFGCAHPEGYRKALQKMKMAEKFHLPIVCFIDTPGAYPGIGAEERGQARAIALNIREMFLLRVPIIGIVIGEGGSGGALGIGVGDRMAALQFSYYSVISPEGCAAILWKKAEKAAAAAEALKLTSEDNLMLGMIETIIPEPLGGAHRNPYETIHNVEAYIIRTLRGLQRYKIENLIENRYKKYRRMGQITYTTNEPEPGNPNDEQKQLLCPL